MSIINLQKMAELFYKKAIDKEKSTVQKLGEELYVKFIYDVIRFEMVSTVRYQPPNLFGNEPNKYREIWVGGKFQWRVDPNTWKPTFMVNMLESDTPAQTNWIRKAMLQNTINFQSDRFKEIFEPIVNERLNFIKEDYKKIGLSALAGVAPVHVNVKVELP